MALGGFALTTFLDSKLGNSLARRPSSAGATSCSAAASRSPRSWCWLGPCAASRATSSSRAWSSPRASASSPTSSPSWIVSGKRDFALIDMRAAGEFDKGHIRGAVSCSTCHADKAEGRKTESFVDLSKKLVIYSDGDGDSIQLPKILTKNQSIYRLAGGYAAWKSEVLAAVSFDSITDEAALEAAKKRESVRAFMAGERATAPVEAKLPVTPIKRSGAHAVAAAEGC